MSATDIAEYVPQAGHTVTDRDQSIHSQVKPIRVVACGDQTFIGVVEGCTKEKLYRISDGWVKSTGTLVGGYLNRPRAFNPHNRSNW